jgi:hypothetical protein
MMNLTQDCSHKDFAVIDCFVNAILKVRNPRCRQPYTDELSVRWSQECHKYDHDIDGFLLSMRNRLAVI